MFVLREAGYVVQPLEKWEYFSESVEVILTFAIIMRSIVMIIILIIIIMLIFMIKLIIDIIMMMTRCPCPCSVESALRKTFHLLAPFMRTFLTQVKNPVVMMDTNNEVGLEQHVIFAKFYGNSFDKERC